MVMLPHFIRGGNPRRRPAQPVAIKRAACPRCGGPVLFSKATWLTCGGACPAGRRIVRAARKAVAR